MCPRDEPPPRKGILADRQCPQCRVAFRSRSPFCSMSCAGTYRWASRAQGGWWPDEKGYIRGHVWENGKHRRVKQHRWVMEQHLGRRLSRDELVHHRNGDRTDNRLENLEVMTRSEHSRLHNQHCSDEERARRSKCMTELHRAGRIPSSANARPTVRRGHAIGEGHPAAKLTNENVRYVRIEHAKGRNYAELAREFGVRPMAIKDACARITWRHIE